LFFFLYVSLLLRQQPHIPTHIAATIFWTVALTAQEVQQTAVLLALRVALEVAVPNFTIASTKAQQMKLAARQVIRVLAGPPNQYVVLSYKTNKVVEANENDRKQRLLVLLIQDSILTTLVSEQMTVGPVRITSPATMRQGAVCLL
jgi:hypothetical protein